MRIPDVHHLFTLSVTPSTFTLIYPTNGCYIDSLGFMKTLIIVAVLLLILYNLGAGLYYMLVDKGESKRTVNALTRHIALSVGLILLVVLAIKMGWIQPHGIGRSP